MAEGKAERETGASTESQECTVKLAECHLVAGKRKRFLPMAYGLPSVCHMLRAFRVLAVSDGEDHRQLGFQGGAFPVHNTEIKTETLGDEK